MQYVTYFVALQQKGGFRRTDSTSNIARASIEGTDRTFFSQPSSTGHANELDHQKIIEDFLNSQTPRGELLDSFIENSDNQRTARWPQLQKALEMCKQKGATLLIGKLGTLASNESFTQILLSTNVPFHCIDQPFVNKTILEAISKHFEIHKVEHGKKIRAGLSKTSAKSGNPNAAEVISKVNKPKIDAAIVFAFLLQLISQDYRRKGYSQRQMVKTLNEEGFTAPEGGKWVLSQLQKVLDRVRLNEISTDVKPILTKINAENLTPAEIAQALNTDRVSPLKPPAWDESQVKKLQDRLQQIEDITNINRFVLGVLPILREYRRRDFSVSEMLMEFQRVGTPIQPPMLIGSL